MFPKVFQVDSFQGCLAPLAGMQHGYQTDAPKLQKKIGVSSNLL
jgi:hypothetical protein